MSSQPSGAPPASASSTLVAAKPSRWYRLLAEWVTLNVAAPLIFWTLMPIRERPGLSAVCLIIAQCILLALNIRFSVVNFRPKPFPFWFCVIGSFLLQLFASFCGLLMLFLWYVGEG